MKPSFLIKLAAAGVVMGLTGCRSFFQNPLANSFHIPFNVKSGAAYPLPKVAAWSLDGRDLSRASVLPDPHSLYVFHYSREQMTGNPLTLMEGRRFYRFWPDGRVLHRSSLMDHRPTAADGDDFRSKQRWDFHVGYYTVIGSEIIIELFVAEQGGMYSRKKGSLSAGGLVMENPLYRKHPMRYERVPFAKGAMVRQPDW